MAQRNHPDQMSPQKAAAVAQLFPDHVPDPACIKDNGKPVFDATFTSTYKLTEKDMSEPELLAWKNFQLYKTSMKIDRRDSVYMALAASDYTNFKVSDHWLGAPYPIIEPNPFMAEVMFGVRWYEHIMSVFFGFGFFVWFRTKPTVRYSPLNVFVQKCSILWMFVMMEMNWGYRSIARLQGRVHNEPECFKYGVVETPRRLEEKIKYWRKYKAYKDEWMRRFDYHVWGMRPGERQTFFSSCFISPFPVLFCEKTEFPMRKNPFILSSKPISKLRLDSMASYYYAKDANTPIEQARPEVNYIYRGGMAT
jgi:hypothetical protein